MPIHVNTAEKKAEIARDVVVAYLSHVKDEELSDLGKVGEAITRLVDVVDQTFEVTERGSPGFGMSPSLPRQTAKHECRSAPENEASMWLSQLALVNFRNFQRLRLEPQPGVLLFCGRNGQGKTNLLESIYVLATTRSPRTSVERELLNWQTAEDRDLAAVITPFARLEGRVRRLEGEVHLELAFETLHSPERTADSAPVIRTIKVNGLPQRATGLVGQLPVVYFSPDDVGLASGPPAGRRHYLNLANSQASAQHLRALQRYNRVLLQRNQVLRQVRERRQPASSLGPWTEQMLEYGTRILQHRVEMLSRVGARAAEIFPSCPACATVSASAIGPPSANPSSRPPPKTWSRAFDSARIASRRARSSRP